MFGWSKHSQTYIGDGTFNISILVIFLSFSHSFKSNVWRTNLFYILFLGWLLTNGKDMAYLNQIAVFSFICLLCNVYGFINFENLEPSNAKEILFQLGSKLKSLGKNYNSDNLEKMSLYNLSWSE